MHAEHYCLELLSFAPNVDVMHCPLQTAINFIAYLDALFEVTSGCYTFVLDRWITPQFTKIKKPVSFKFSLKSKKAMFDNYKVKKRVKKCVFNIRDCLK